MWEALSERRPGILDTTVARRRRPPTFGELGFRTILLKPLPFHGVQPN